MTVYLVWRTPAMIADTYELEGIYDNKESAEEHAKRIEGDVEEYEVLTKDCFAYNRTGKGV